MEQIMDRCADINECGFWFIFKMGYIITRQSIHKDI